MISKIFCFAVCAVFAEVYSSEDIPKQDFCRLPAVTGKGRAGFRQWYFNNNSTSKQCEQFIWGGGKRVNENNFNTKLECERVCIHGIECPQAEHPPPGCRANQEKGEDGCPKNDIICDLKPGNCPATYEGGCTRECLFSDTECTGDKKCCTIGCNVVCVAPVP